MHTHTHTHTYNSSCPIFAALFHRHRHTQTHTHTHRERERERQTQTHRHTHQRKPHVDPKGGKRLDWHRGEKKLNNYLYYLNPYYLNTITRFTQRVEKT